MDQFTAMQSQARHNSSDLRDEILLGTERNASETEARMTASIENAEVRIIESIDRRFKSTEKLIKENAALEFKDAARKAEAAESRLSHQIKDQCAYAARKTNDVAAQLSEVESQIADAARKTEVRLSQQITNQIAGAARKTDDVAARLTMVESRIANSARNTEARLTMVESRIADAAPKPDSPSKSRTKAWTRRKRPRRCRIAS
jgi:hypothetical protein